MRGLFVLLLIPIVFAQECEGCLFKGECLEVGIQKISEDKLYHCSREGAVLPVKGIGDICSFNYECISFYCNGLCDVRERSSFSFTPIFITVVIVAISFATFYFLRRKQKQQLPVKKKLRVYYQSAKVKREFDPFEKKFRDMGFKK